MSWWGLGRRHNGGGSGSQSELINEVKNLKQTLSGLDVTTTVNISGQPVQVSGEIVIAKISGEIIGVVSGGILPVHVVSGQVIGKVSGEVLATEQQGAWGIQVSGAVQVSGIIVSKISGEVVNISGYPVKISGETVDIAVPTQLKTFSLRSITASSGGEVLHSGAVKSVLLKALGTMYVGGSGYFPYSGFGFEMVSGEAIDVTVSNFADIYLFSTTSGDNVTFLGVD